MKLLINGKMGDYEKENKKASYSTIVERFIGNIVLCNNIALVDNSIYDNMWNGVYYKNRITEEYVTMEEYNNDTKDLIVLEYKDIYQYYLCNISDYEKEKAQEAGLIISYSDALECDVLCVDHWGTSWDYVLTDVELVENYEDLED